MTPPRRVVVVGCGAAGTAAAWAARESGADVSIVGDFDGATGLFSGALDVASWEADSTSPAPIDDDVLALCARLEIWRIDEHYAHVATPWGRLRTARGRDRAILDLTPLRSARIAVPRAARADWDADLLSRAWRDDPWCAEQSVRFDAISIDLMEHEQERYLTDAELASVFDDEARRGRLVQHLRERIDGFDAVLFGPWLGVESDAALQIGRALGRPVGETLSVLASAAGQRFALARDRMFRQLGVSSHTAHVSDIRSSDRGISVAGDAGLELDGDVVVLASGGIAGGGFAYDPFECDPGLEIPSAPRAPFSPAFRVGARMVFDGRPARTVSSMFGLSLERYAWPNQPAEAWALDTLHFAHRGQVCMDDAGQPLPRVLVAGQAGVAHTMGVIASLASGARAGRLAARIAVTST